MKKSVLILFSVLLSVFVLLPSENAEAAKKDEELINLIIDGENTVYDGTVAGFIFNDKKINIKKTPTYIFDDTAYINIKKVIKKAIPDAKYFYNKSIGRIKITRGDCSIIFYTDNMIVYKNGKATYNRNIPKCIEQDGNGGNYYLPGRLVFETLGYSYVWDDENKVSKVTETAATGKAYELYKYGIVLDNKVTRDIDNYHGELNIKLPDSVTSEDVVISDNIYKNEIYISIKGDHKKFFDNLSFNDDCENCVVQIREEYHPEDDITLLKIITQTDSEGLCLLHKDLISDENIKLIFDRAGDLYDKIVILDAGHGANDPGTQNFGIDEKDCNLIITKLIGRIIEKSGIKVFYTRYDDTLIALRDRAYLGGRLDADMFVSIHHNANNSPEKNGTSVYYSLLNYNATLENTLTSRIMAETMQNDLIEKIQTNDMKVLTTDFTVTKYNNVPSVLVELSFLSNPEECYRSITDEFRNAASESIAGSILKLYNQG
ncbi:MAG: N-acetylmuramoyl-L-alanine amidase [Lachnospiraceae bacterium]|nr:N-acetylmuramoyl-L-alanine amidase [Lachnospiraceae bacterium]